mgnify:CR=1 FL=1
MNRLSDFYFPALAILPSGNVLLSVDSVEFFSKTHLNYTAINSAQLVVRMGQ